MKTKFITDLAKYGITDKHRYMAGVKTTTKSSISSSSIHFATRKEAEAYLKEIQL